MTELVKVSRGGQVTIPAALRRQVGIEIGDYVEVQITDDHLILIPKRVIDKDQAYFWSDSWQKDEREAEQDLHQGRVERFESLDELIADLDAEE